MRSGAVSRGDRVARRYADLGDEDAVEVDVVARALEPAAGGLVEVARGVVGLEDPDHDRVEAAVEQVRVARANTARPYPWPRASGAR